MYLHFEMQILMGDLRTITKQHYIFPLTLPLFLLQSRSFGILSSALSLSYSRQTGWVEGLRRINKGVGNKGGVCIYLSKMWNLQILKQNQPGIKT